MNPFKRGDRVCYYVKAGFGKPEGTFFGRIIDLYNNPVKTRYKPEGWILLIELDHGSTIEKHESQIEKV